MDVVIDEHDFQENFCDMVTSTIDIGISVRRPVYLADCIEKDSQCDYHKKVYKPGELLVCFISVLVRMYANYVLNCLFELDLSLRDEEILVEEVCTFASDLMYEFFNTNYLFFYELSNLCCLEDLNTSCCYGILVQKKYYRSYE